MTNRIDMDAVRAHYRTLYARHIVAGAYPADALVGVEFEKVGGARWGRKVRLNDLEAFCTAVRREVRDGTGIHIRINPLRNRDYLDRLKPNGVPAFQAGTKEDSLAFPALYMDWDVAGGSHKPFTDPEQKGMPHPTRIQVEQMLTESPWAEGLRTSSGTGLHSYWPLATPLQNNSEAEQLLKRWQTFWVTECHRRGFGCDLAVGTTPSQTLRLAGSVNWKPDPDGGVKGRPVKVLLHDENVVYDLAEIESLLPMLPPERKKSTPAGAIPKGRKRKGKLFSELVSVGFIMEGVFGMRPHEVTEEETQKRRWTYGDSSTGSNAVTMLSTPQEGRARKEIAFAFSSTLAGIWGVKIGAQPVDSFDLLRICFGGDVERAKALAGMELYRQESDALILKLRKTYARHREAS